MCSVNRLWALGSDKHLLSFPLLQKSPPTKKWEKFDNKHMPETSLSGRVYCCQLLTGLYALSTVHGRHNYVFSWSHQVQPYIVLEVQFFLSGKTLVISCALKMFRDASYCVCEMCNSSQIWCLNPEVWMDDISSGNFFYPKILMCFLSSVRIIALVWSAMLNIN